MDNFVHDLRGALRYLRRNLAFSAAAIVILALGIGAITTIFSVTETLLLRPLPYPDSERLVSLRSVNPLRGSLDERTSAGTLADWQLQASSFEAIAGYRWNTIDVLSSAGGERLKGVFATPEFVRVFGIQLEGRGFVAADRGARTIVLSRDVWRRRFNADRSLIGKTVELNARNFRRVGSTPYTSSRRSGSPCPFSSSLGGLPARSRDRCEHDRLLDA